VRMSDGRRLIDPVREFLSAPRCAVLATLGADGAPRQVVIHYTLDGDHVRLNGRSDRGWVTNVRRDPRATLIVHDHDNYLHYVAIRGIARPLADRDALEDAMVQAARYGEDPQNFAGQSRASFRLDPEHVYEYR
jgi:PPOX class probable F420-dependent enzyme